MARLKITLKKSTIGRSEKLRRVVESMGLRKIGQSKEFDDNPVIRGMIKKTEHMITVENLE